MECRNINPYGGVDWKNCQRITGCTHMHCLNNGHLQQFLEQGLEFVTLSNYYPSAPYYPLKSICENSFKCYQHGFIHNGQWVNETVDWNCEISHWSEDLPVEIAAKLPFKEGEPIFSDLPKGIIEAPNGEHHWFKDYNVFLHVTAPGAQISSSSFDRNSEFQLEKHGFSLGAKVPWRIGFKRLLDSLITPDGGGIIIAHPAWSHLPVEFICELLDSDPRVLGIEIFNDNSRVDFSDVSDTIWDAVLATGRQCYGFCVQDHPPFPQPWRGKIVLLSQERSARGALRAMRQGRFYGAITGNGLKFEYINFDGQLLTARCNRPVEFALISKVGMVSDTVQGTEFSYFLPKKQRKEHVFLRLTAREGRGGEKLFSQPIILT